MLLLGVLQAQAAGAGPTPLVTDYDLLDERVLSTAESAVVFSSLAATYGSTYQHLQIRWVTRNTTGSTEDEIWMRMNGDSGANYSGHQLFNAQSAGYANTTISYIAAVPSGGAAANTFGAGVTDILDAFETTKYKTFRTISARSNVQVKMWSGSWRNLAAIDSITIQGGANHAQFSRFSLYGLKAGA